MFFAFLFMATAYHQICYASDFKDSNVGGEYVNITSITTDDILQYDGTDWVNVQTSTIVPDKAHCWTAGATQPLRQNDAIAPLLKNEGSNIDIISAAFDDSTDECRFINFIIADDILTTGTIDFTLLWYASTAAENDVVWDVRWHEVGDGENWDGLITTTALNTCTSSDTQDIIDKCTGSVNLSTLGWVGGDWVEMNVCRDANHANDDLVGDAQMILFCIDYLQT